MISIPAAIGMICTSDILILIFSGKEFLSGSLAAKILSAKVVVGAINRILAYQICIPYKKDKEVLISTVCGAVFNLFANAVLIPKFGVTGASVATFFFRGGSIYSTDNLCKSVFQNPHPLHKSAYLFYSQHMVFWD